MLRYGLSVLVAGTTLAVAGSALALEPEEAIRVAQPPMLSVGIEGYAGMGVLAAGSRADSHALGGGLLRLRASYAQLGGFVEAAELPRDSLTGFGALMGGWIPFRHWVTFDVMLGAGRHTYENTDRRYGPDGYSVSSWFGTLRLGVSDRSKGLLGGRLGAMLLASVDFSPHDIRWRYGPAGTRQEVTGVRRVGGFSLGVAVTVGFDFSTPSESTTAERSVRWPGAR